MYRFFFIGITLWIYSLCFAQDIPNKPIPERLVNDYANILSVEQKQSLENKLVQYDDSTSTQIAVVIVPTIGNNDLVDYALQIIRSWGIGSSKNNNGALLLVVIDTRKVRIATGYGLEGVLPDAICKRIIENEFIPYVRQGDFYSAINKATDAMIKAVANEYTDQRSQQEALPTWVAFLIFIAIVILVIILFLKRGGGGGTYSRKGRNSSMLPWFIAGSMLNSGRTGSSSGGGFGGFGGGSSGGGGASGGW